MIQPTEHDVVVVGAGIAGLATAYRLQQHGRRVLVLEADDAVGGRMRSVRSSSFVIDTGAETIGRHGYDRTWQLIRELGLAAEVVPVRSKIGLWRDGRIHPWVGHPLGLVLGAGLSVRGRVSFGRMFVRLLMMRRQIDPDAVEATPLADQTVSEFCDRYGAEVVDLALRPAIGTAFGWTPERASMAALAATILPTRGTAAWMTYRSGMDTLALRLAESLDVRVRSAVRSITPSPGGVSVQLVNGEPLHAPRVVLAVPAPLARELFRDMPDDERDFIESVTFSPMIRVTCTLRRALSFSTSRWQPEMYAVLVAGHADGLLAGITLDHHKASTRAPHGHGIATLLVSPGRVRESLGSDDDDLVSRLLVEARGPLPELGDVIDDAVVHRFRHAQPEVTAAALERRPAFMSRTPRTIEYAGDWVSLRPTSEAAVRSADWAVSRLVEHEDSLEKTDALGR